MPACESKLRTTTLPSLFVQTTVQSTVRADTGFPLLSTLDLLHGNPWTVQGINVSCLTVTERERERESVVAESRFCFKSHGFLPHRLWAFLRSYFEEEMGVSYGKMPVPPKELCTPAGAGQKTGPFPGDVSGGSFGLWLRLRSGDSSWAARIFRLAHVSQRDVAPKIGFQAQGTKRSDLVAFLIARKARGESIWDPAADLLVEDRGLEGLRGPPEMISLRAGKRMAHVRGGTLGCSPGVPRHGKPCLVLCSLWGMWASNETAAFLLLPYFHGMTLKGHVPYTSACENGPKRPVFWLFPYRALARVLFEVQASPCPRSAGKDSGLGGRNEPRRVFGLEEARSRGSRNQIHRGLNL